MTAHLTLDSLNDDTAEAFCAAMGDIWEHAPWVARGVVHQRPFASVDALHRAMVQWVAAQDEPTRVALFAGHPELAGDQARGGLMTEDSTVEQGALSLHRLDPQEAARWDALNQAYRARFGFPFILCVGRHTRASALQAFQARLKNERATELVNTLEEIGHITRLRLTRRVQAAVEHNTLPTA
jgi:2-oxo-4-hydroxy-4-carboxy-5-ureidoimidazoline decarboxylase